MYRHPCMQKSEFNEVILLGDSNIDLLKCDSNKNISDFLEIILFHLSSS